MRDAAGLAAEIARTCATEMRKSDIFTMSFYDYANGMSADALTADQLDDFFARYVPRIREVAAKTHADYGYAMAKITVTWWKPGHRWEQSWDCLA